MADFWSNLHFLRPWWLLALIPGAALWWFLHRSTDFLRQYKGLIAPHLLTHLVIGEQKQGVLHPLRIIPVVWILLVVALAGPSWRMEPSPFAEQQAGLVILLKTSRSMAAEDLPPSRLERAVYKMHDLFEIRGAEPSGLVAYSGSAHLVMPLTKDTRIIEVMAAELDPTVMPVDGDRLDLALELAGKQIGQSKSTGSVLVIADGIDENQLAQLTEYRQKGGPPVQVLVMATDPPTAKAAVARGADALGAAVHVATVDDSDVRSIVAGAKQMVRDVSAHEQGARRRDEGYWLVPLLTLLIALWARRGWSLGWQ